MNGDAANGGDEPTFERAHRSPTGTAETLCPDRDEPSERGTTDGSKTGDETANGAKVTEETTDGAAIGSTSTNTASERTPASGSTGPPDESRLGERLRAVERAVTGTERSIADVHDGATAAAEREELTDRLDDVEARVEELEAATQALRGYAGSIRAVNREVERRADLALARASGADGAAADPATGPKESRHGSGGAVPSEAALDAAVPSEPPRGTDHGTAVSGGTSGRNGDSNDGTRTDPNGDRSEDGSWPSETLDRLRESL